MTPDIVIIGSGIGGATLAAGLAASGASILILEQGGHLRDRPENRDPRAIFQRGFFRPKDNWHLPDGTPFNAGNYCNVGGNSKFFGAVMLRYRREDFTELAHPGGVSPAWPFAYEDLAPFYDRAEALFQVRGRLGDDPTEPPHGTAYPHAPIPDEAPIAKVRARLKDQGLHPFSLPLAVDIDRWLTAGATPWDAHPHADDGKFDAETASLKAALAHPNVTLQTGARVTRLQASADGSRIDAVHYEADGATHRLSPKLVVLSGGAVLSAALLLRSRDDRHPTGLANASDQVGRNFMNHNTSAVIAAAPWYRNDSIYQKTFGFNDFYLSDGKGGLPLGNVQLLGRITAPILKANVKLAPEWALGLLADHAIDFLAMSEDLPNPDSRVTVDGERIIFNWVRSNWEAHLQLVAELKRILRRAGFPLILSRPFDRRTPSHQCGTVRIGTDPATAPLDPFCRAFQHRNLFVVDASFLPTSAAVNPALTIAAQALRVADHMLEQDLHA